MFLYQKYKLWICKELLIKQIFDKYQFSTIFLIPTFQKFLTTEQASWRSQQASILWTCTQSLHFAWQSYARTSAKCNIPPNLIWETFIVNLTYESHSAKYSGDGIDTGKINTSSLL